jgi:hypothetical protein
MSLLQATSLLNSATKAVKTRSLPDLTSTVNALSSAGVISNSQATLVKSGLAIGNSISKGQTPSLSVVTNALSATGVINKSEANTINKNIAIGSAGLSTSTLNNPQKLLATAKSLGVVDSATAKTLSAGLAIVSAASKGNTGGIIAGSLALADVPPAESKVASTTLNSVVTTVQDANANSGYKTTDKILPDIGSIGKLTKEECVKVLEACQKAISQKYVVNGKRNIWRKVHNRGEYGAYRMTISQLIDINFLKPTIQEWAEDCIKSQPTGPGVSERIKSYAEAVQDAGGDFDFAPFKREAANNLQYFFLYNPIPLNHEAAVRSMISFITSEEMQDKAAYYYLKKAYVDLSNAKIINEDTAKETVAGLVSIALCSKLDDAIKFSQGVIKTNADGINSKFWYDTGWNAVAEKPKNINSDKPLLKEGARAPTTEISTKALLETAKDLSSVISGKNINGVVAGLAKSGVIPGDVASILDAGLGIAASVVKDKLAEIDKAKDALQKASSVLPAGASSALKSISSIKSAVSSASSKVSSISSLASKANVPTISAIGNVATGAKQITALAKQVEDTAMSAVGAAVGAAAASGKVDPASLSFIGESLKSGFGLANDPQTAVINELNRRGLCPPGSTALLRASIDGITDPAKISDLIASEVDKMGNVGAALPALNTKLIESTGAKKGLLDKFEQAKAASISAIGMTKPELTSLISSAGSASMESLKNQASKAASGLLNTATTAASGLSLANNLTSVAAGAKDPVAAASALGASAVSKVSGAASSATGAVAGIAGNAQGALNSASGAVSGALSSAASGVTDMLGGSVPSVAELPAEGQIVSTYLPVTPATVPEPPPTGAASADAVPSLPSTQVAAAVGGPTQASTPPVDPNPIKTTHGSVEVAYQWTASNGVITVSSGGTPVASVNLIDKIDSRSPQYNMLMAAIDGAIKQERINNYKATASDIEKMTVKVADFTIVYEYQPERKNFVLTVTDDLKFFNSITTENLYTKAETLIRAAFSQTERARGAAITMGEDAKALRLGDLGIELGKNGVTDLEFLKKTFLDKNKVGGDTALSTDLATAKIAIQSDFIPNLEKVKKTFSNNTPVAAQGPSKSNTDGTTTTVVTEKYGDGSVVKTTIVEDQKGFASTKKEVTRVAPPIATPSPNTNPTQDDAVEHPASADPAQALSQSPPSAVAIPPTNDSSRGYTDPKGQYPKKDLGGKPDTNPLAVGVNSPHIQNDPASQGARQETLSTGASPAAKNALRKRDVPKAGRHGASWSQPKSPYAAQYPYNKVTASESGHVTEIDDTPGAERLHTAHKSGTFQEIGPNGTQVTKVVGDNYTIIDNNGYILIEGKANVHVAGECNVIIMGDANLTMNGKVNMDVHNDFNLNVAGHFGLSVGGGIFIRNDGVFSHDNKGDMHVHGAGNFISTIDGIHNTTASGYRTTSKGDYHVKVAGISYHTSVGNINQDTDGSILNKAAETIDSKSGTHTNIESLGNTNIKSAGSINAESIAATNVKSANVVNVEGADSINVKSANAVNVNSAAATNVKSGAAINVEGAGNINLKAPEVASSKFSAPTIDVSTLNAATTNLKGTHNTPDDTTDIKGSASPVSPGSATTAGSANSADPASEAAGAKIATLANPIPVEKPVSISVSPIAGGADGVTSSGAGGQSQPLSAAGGIDFDTRATTNDDTALA